MGRHNQIPEEVFKKYAFELSRKGPREGIADVAARVFKVTKGYAKNKAWDWKKHPAFIEEEHRIEEMEKSEGPVSKDEKLTQNKILIDEAYRARDTENYIKLVRIDNEMQGHTKASEQQDDKNAAGTALIGELIKSLRDKNKDAVLDAKVVNSEIVPIEE